jgi:hypothetical protein
MLRHYRHIRLEAKRTALESIVRKQTNGLVGQTEASPSIDRIKRVGYPHQVRGYRNGGVVRAAPKSDCSELPTITQQFEGEYPQNPPHLANSDVHRN